MRPASRSRPGFINMLSWSTESLLVDGRSQGEIRQGVTTRDLRRRQLDGPAQRRHEEARRRADGRHQVRDHVDDARPSTCASSSGAACRTNVASYRRRHDDPRTRDRPRGQEADAGAARRDARARASGDGGGRARHRLVADLRAGVLCAHRGTDRAVQGGGAVSRQVHLAHAQRREPAGRSGRRADSDQPRGEDSGGDLPPQGRRAGELAEDGRR